MQGDSTLAGAETDMALCAVRPKASMQNETLDM